MKNIYVIAHIKSKIKSKIYEVFFVFLVLGQ